jgi:hypothetical protein
MTQISKEVKRGMFKFVQVEQKKYLPELLIGGFTKNSCKVAFIQF